MNLAEYQKIDAVSGLLQQLLLGDGAVFQVHGEGTDAHGGIVACLGGIAGGLPASHSGGLHVVQQGV